MTDANWSEQYLYHVAPRDACQTIAQEGIQPQDSHREGLEADLTKTAGVTGIDLPITRQECVFCYLTLSQATDSLIFGVPQGIQQAEGVAVIDRAQVTRDIYVGEFQLISDAIDWQYRDTADHTMISTSYHDALRRYAATLTPLSAFETVTQIQARFRLPELIIDDGIRPGAIVEWVFAKRIRATAGLIK